MNTLQVLRDDLDVRILAWIKEGEPNTEGVDSSKFQLQCLIQMLDLFGYEIREINGIEHIVNKWAGGENFMSLDDAMSLYGGRRNRRSTMKLVDIVYGIDGVKYINFQLELKPTRELKLIRKDKKITTYSNFLRFTKHKA